MKALERRMGASENWRADLIADLASVQDSTAAQIAALIGEIEQMNRWRADLIADLASVQDSTAAQIAAISDHLRSLSANVAGNEQNAIAFERSVRRDLRALTQQGEQLAVNMQRLSEELYATPYMANPSALLTHDDDGRAQIGYRNRLPLTSDIYRGFEDIFRGPEEFIRERQRVYLELVDVNAPVLDVGCGRGEFLDLLAAANIRAIGVDHDAGMIERCREKGLTVVHADGLRYLDSQPDESLGAIFAAQVIEHLRFDKLLAFLRLAERKLIPGGVMIAETVNPHAVPAFKMFWIDPTHRGPIFPEVATALCALHGFAAAFVLFPLGAGDLATDLRSQGEYAIVAYKDNRQYDKDHAPSLSPRGSHDDRGRE